MEDTPESEIKKFPWQTKAILKHYSLSENAKNEHIRVLIQNSLFYSNYHNFVKFDILF